MGFIRLYQKTGSFREGIAQAFHIPHASCRFIPTCSQYMYIAVEKYGAVKGIWLGLRRIARCQPFSKGGFDPVH